MITILAGRAIWVEECLEQTARQQGILLFVLMMMMSLLLTIAACASAVHVAVRMAVQLIAVLLATVTGCNTERLRDDGRARLLASSAKVIDDPCERSLLQPCPQATAAGNCRSLALRSVVAAAAASAAVATADTVLAWTVLLLLLMLMAVHCWSGEERESQELDGLKDG